MKWLVTSESKEANYNSLMITLQELQLASFLHLHILCQGYLTGSKKDTKVPSHYPTWGNYGNFPAVAVWKKIKYYHAAVLIEVKACSCVASAILYIMEKNCCFNKTIFFEEKCSLPTDTFPGILPSIRQVERAHMIKMQIYRVQCRIHSHDSVFTAW